MQSEYTGCSNDMWTKDVVVKVQNNFATKVVVAVLGRHLIDLLIKSSGTLSARAEDLDEVDSQRRCCS